MYVPVVSRLVTVFSPYPSRARDCRLKIVLANIHTHTLLYDTPPTKREDDGDAFIFGKRMENCRTRKLATCTAVSERVRVRKEQRE